MSFSLSLVLVPRRRICSRTVCRTIYLPVWESDTPFLFISFLIRNWNKAIFWRRDKERMKERVRERRELFAGIIVSFTRGRRISHLQGFLRSLVQLSRNFVALKNIFSPRLSADYKYFLFVRLFSGLFASVGMRLMGWCAGAVVDVSGYMNQPWTSLALNGNEISLIKEMLECYRTPPSIA